MGHQLFPHEGRGVQISEDAAGDFFGGFVGEPAQGFEAVLIVLGLIEAGHVDPGDGGQSLQQLLLGLPRCAPGPIGVHQLRLRLLPVADDDGVEEGGDGLRIHGAGAARHDEGAAFLPVPAQKGDVRELHHGQDVAVAHLVQQGKAHDVEALEGAPGLQGEQRLPRLPQGLLHVRPGGEAPLAAHPVHTVQHMVEDAGPQVGHADLVHVREAQGKAKVRLGLHLHVVFTADVPGGLLHPGEDEIEHFVSHGSRLAFLPVFLPVFPRF